MEAEAAGSLLVTMQAAWRGFASDDAAATMWLSVIGRQEPSIGAHACRLLVNSLVRPPTIADWNEQVRHARRLAEPESAHRALGGIPDAPMDRNVAKRVREEMEAAHREREQRRASMSAEDFIRSEGHDPATHWLNPNGFVLRKVWRPATRERIDGRTYRRAAGNK